ncbi:hypothetical protein RBEAN4_0022 [Rickettsia bellii str. RML An4]|uniref:Uncharacterized protein n=1 Tax=Rickettsia bellii str. RML An4 TaxID=1359193 RepID=A0A0F3QA69_RICBE|nr:hypothetical protein [Rickettsia bellii]ABV79735.1 hypothetical protein A1I_07160 [Rickettsia bellii OSU 85-389]KJV89056.1 hypothetical protein RBEAN4_0022 [Rickettsia bellii str. RML An4]
MPSKLPPKVITCACPGSMFNVEPGSLKLIDPLAASKLNAGWLTSILRAFGVPS